MLAGGRCWLAMMALLLLGVASGGGSSVEAEPQLTGCSGARLPGSVPAAGTWPPRADAVVAKEGGCGSVACYRTIQKALDAAPFLVPCEKRRYVVLVKSGVYEEPFILVKRKNVMLLREGADRTVITGNKSNVTLTPMDQTATVIALGHGFLAQDLTIRNTAGADKKQAVALRSNSNKSVVYRCTIEGYEDTLYAENGRQMYIESNISGTVDFVFGNAKAVFHKCRLQVRRPLEGKHNVITAQGRNNATSLESGFSFHECIVEAAPGHDLKGFDTFLGRPYRKYSHVAFINSFLGDVVNVTGWVSWDRYHEVKDTTKTVEYREYGNHGPGAGTERRVKWDGFRVLANDSEAAKYTADRFIDASQWVPEQIQYDHGLGVAPRIPPRA